MSPKLKIVFCILFLTITACGEEPGGRSTDTSQAPFIVMDDSLETLIQDFNDAAGSVRLLFLSGPTCGICLRGLADLNAALLDGNTDSRLKTFVVHVPTLNANETDARNSTVLIENPHTRHYWEATGVIGRRYQEVMGIGYYAWDMWFIYGPDARWEGEMPPEPEFWMHQLGPLPDEKYLDAEEFARKARSLLESLPSPANGPGRVAGHGDSRVELESVAQPVGVALEQHIMGRGGYHNLAAMKAIRMEGSLSTEAGANRLTVTAGSDGTISRMVGDSRSGSVARREGSNIVRPEAAVDRGLPWPLEREVLRSFELTGPLVAWKAKGHELKNSMDMVRLDKGLAWELDLIQETGHRWRVYLDSHSGMELRRVLLNDSGEVLLEIRFDDYRIAEPDTPYQSTFSEHAGKSNRGFYRHPGYVFPFRITYFDGEGDQLVSEEYEYIDVSFEGENE